jgi:hypothetical protein
MVTPPAPIAQLPAEARAACRKWSDRLIAGGAAACLVGVAVDWTRHHDLRQFGFSWLLAFMFWLSLVLGALFFVMLHHLTDASWSVPIRRVCEHLACLIFPGMLVLFLPITILAPRLYAWLPAAGHPDGALRAKWPFLTLPMFYLVAALCFAVWSQLAWRLRSWSLQQDVDGSSHCTERMRVHSAWGIVLYAFTLSLAAIMWMQSLQYQWHSTMYGVYYFAGCVWFALAVLYVLASAMDRRGWLHATMRREQFYLLGSLLLAFTVFSAYIHFGQYFIIWNGNIPEETYWYVVRERGSWFAVGLTLVFGHFLLPFLALLRIDVKLVWRFMVPLCLWIGVMQYVDLAFNISPVLHPSGFSWRWFWLDCGCIALMGGVLGRFFVRDLERHAVLPIRDPRMAEALGLYLVPVPSAQASGEAKAPAHSAPAPGL